MYRIKNYVLSLTIALLLLSEKGNAQTIQLCNLTESAITQQRQNDPRYQQWIDAMYKRMHTSVNGGNASLSSSNLSTLYIPVVVHIMHDSGEVVGQGLNLSTAQIQSQIDKLNACFANNLIQTGPNAVDTRIQFCLARNTAPSSLAWSNPAEPGIMRYEMLAADNGVLHHQTTVNSNAALLAKTHLSSVYFPFTDYLNIWVVADIDGGGVAGYAPRPLLNTLPIDGVVMAAPFFGDNTVNNNSFPLNPTYEAGTILAHEVGHYLSLYHTFTGNCSGMTNSDCQTQGDYICDTPPNTDQGFACLAIDNCVENITPWGNRPNMPENFMTWHDDDCLNTFTYEQAGIMRAYLQNFRPNLIAFSNLIASGIVGPSGCLPAVLVADINHSFPTCVNSAIQFSTPTGPGYNAVAWNWSFQNGSPATSTLLNPVVSFSSTGSWQVILTAFDSLNNSITDTLLINITPCNPIQSSQGHWYFGHYAGLDFSSGVGVPDYAAAQNLSMTTSEATVSVSNASGQLLFFSDAESIWNSNHQVATPNYIGYLAHSKSQTAAAPFPGHPDQYYVFGGPAQEDTTFPPMNYNIIHAVPGTVTPIVVNDTIARPAGCDRWNEQITVVPHCNGIDYWVIIPTWTNSQNPSSALWRRTIAVFLLSSSGLTNPTNLSSSAPALYTFPNVFFQNVGLLRASPDGLHLVTSTSQGVTLFDFDPSTGNITNPSVVQPYFQYVYAISFSPDSKVLYWTDPNSFDFVGKVIGSTSAPTVVAQSTSINDFITSQLGPDSILYIGHIGQSHISRITNPNNIYAPGFDYNTLVFSNLNYTVSTDINFPHFIDAHPSSSSLSASATQISCDSVHFSIYGCIGNAQIQWDFGDASNSNQQDITHVYTNGDYVATVAVYVNNNLSFTDTFNIHIGPPSPISGPSVVCVPSLNPSQYSVAAGYTSYYWFASGAASLIGPSNTNLAQVTATGPFSLFCLIQNGPNCYYQLTYNVTTASPPVASAGPNDTLRICPGGSVSLGDAPTASGGTGPYSYTWFPNAQLANDTLSNTTATPISTTTYTVYVSDANGCSAFDQMTVLVDTTLSVTASFSTLYNPCDYSNPIDLTASANPAGGTFSGVAVSGNFFDPTSAGIGQYVLTYTYTDINTGCSDQDTANIAVIACCGIIGNGTTTTDQESSSLYGTSFPLGPVRINGTFYIDNNFDILGFNGPNSVLLGPDARIVVKPGATLLIDQGSVLQACSGTMWYGIVVLPGGEVDILGFSYIEDAQQALTSTNGGKFTIDGANFRKNYRNVVVENHTLQGLHPGTIVRTHFQGSLLGLSPYAGIKTYTGLEVINVDSIYIGTPGNTLLENTFTAMDIGAYTFRSNVYFRNNYFINITSNTYQAIPACCINNSCNNQSVCDPPPAGTALWSRQGNVVVGGAVANMGNRFRLCTRGVLGELNVSMVIQNNSFLNIDNSNTVIPAYGINLRQCNNNSFSVTNNTFQNVRAGIILGHSVNCTALIANNVLDNFSQTGIQILQTNQCTIDVANNSLNTTGTLIAKYGIRIQNAVVTNTTPYIHVYGNVSRNCTKHIQVTSFPYIVVDQSNAAIIADGLPASTTFGIQIQNSPSALVDGNTVQKMGGIPNDTNYRKRLYGISMETSCYNSILSNNGLFKLGTGAQYFNAANFPSTVTCNSFWNNFSGFALNNTYIGDQGLSTLQAPPYGVNQDNQWVMPNNGFYFSLQGIGNISMTNWYYRNNVQILFPSANSINPLGVFQFQGPQSNAPMLCTNYCPNGPCQQQQLVQVAAQTGLFDTLSGASLYMSNQAVYRQLEQDPLLMEQGSANDTILKTFFQENATTNLGKIDAAYRQSSDRDTAQANSTTQGIAPNDQVDMNHRIVLTIYLSSWAKGQREFSAADSAILYTIATQNVQTGGTAVYDARVMLDLDLDDVGDFSVNRIQASLISPVVGAFYPNPAHGSALYQYTLQEDEEGVLVLFDVLGNELVRYTLHAGEHEQFVLVDQFASGLYIYRVYVNNEQRDAGKLVVQH